MVGTDLEQFFVRVVATADETLLAVCARSEHGIDANGKNWPWISFGDRQSRISERL